ncbi:phage tail protein [Providencia rettgeri]
MKYFALLTTYGEKVLAEATALGTKIELTHMSVGDGGGSLPAPDTKQTKLINERRKAAINTLFIDPLNPNQIIAEQVIPENEGGWWIREIGLFDKSGALVAIANCPETYKPLLVEGSGRTQTIRVVLIVSHTESVTLKIDPTVVLATRKYVDDAIQVLDKRINELTASDVGAVPVTRKVNGKPLSTDITLNSGDVGSYTKAETDTCVADAKKAGTDAQAAANTANTAATNANNNANGRVPSGRKVNNKPLSADINLTAGDVGAYDKDESDTELKKKRDVNDLSFKGAVNLLNPSKDDFLKFGGDGTGYALQVAIANNNTNGRFYFHDRVGKKTIYLPIHEKSGTIALTTDIPNVVNATGSSTTDIMNQNSVTNELNKKFDKTGGTITTTSGRAINIVTKEVSSGYIQISDENANAIHQIGKLGSASTLSIKNVSENATVTITATGIRFNNDLVALKSEIPSFVTKFQDVTTSRSNNVNYVNTNSHPIFIVLQSRMSVNQNSTYTVNGVVVRWAASGSAEGFLTSATIPVPPGATYSANGFDKWIEVS